VVRVVGGGWRGACVCVRCMVSLVIVHTVDNYRSREDLPRSPTLLPKLVWIPDVPHTSNPNGFLLVVIRIGRAEFFLIVVSAATQDCNAPLSGGLTTLIGAETHMAMGAAMGMYPSRTCLSFFFLFLFYFYFYLFFPAKQIPEWA